MTWLLSAVAAAALAWFLWEKRQRKTHAMPGGIHTDISVPYEQEYELYHNGLSLCSKKVRVCLKELGISFAEHHIDLIETGSYEVVSRHYLKVNPAGILPCLVHNGHPVYESHDIITYCAEQSGSSLVPSDPEQLPVMEHWMDLASIKEEGSLDGLDKSAGLCTAVLTVPLFASGMVEIPYHKLVEGFLFHRLKERPLMFLLFKLRGIRGLPGLPPLVKQSKRAHRAMSAHLDALEAQLNGKQWICGDEYSLADISWMVIFERLVEADWMTTFAGPDLRPGIWAYWQRLQQRPGYAGISEYRLPVVDRATARLVEFKREHHDFAQKLAAVEAAA